MMIALVSDESLSPLGNGCRAVFNDLTGYSNYSAFLIRSRCR
jgi:hypothetical protein